MRNLSDYAQEQSNLIDYYAQVCELPLPFLKVCASVGTLKFLKACEESGEDIYPGGAKLATYIVYEVASAVQQQIERSNNNV